MSHPLDAFIPHPDAREHFSVTVKAPPHLVFAVARDFDMQSIPLVRGIFWLRSKLLGAHEAPRVARGFIDETRALGWGRLQERTGRLFVAGAVCQPWLPDVTFTPVPPDRFAAYAEPGVVRIAWTLEAYALGGTSTLLVTETRAQATDETARKKFLRYWRWARFGILPIRWLMLPAIRREAEARWRAQQTTHAPRIA